MASSGEPAAPGRGRRAIVLLSGGLDSTTTLAMARADGFECWALTVDYGQRHQIELEAARRVAAALGARDHAIVRVDLGRFGGSALTADLAVPKDRAPSAMTDIPVTYVPARNTVLLSLALAWAETLGAEDIFIGVNALDYSVSGDARVWVRTTRWARLMSIENFYALPEDSYETAAVDPETLQVTWRRVTHRARHRDNGRRCFRVMLERGFEIVITEDHSLYTLDETTLRPEPVKGSAIVAGMPIVVPFGLSGIATAWSTDLGSIDLGELARAPKILVDDGCLTNRLRSTRLPLRFPLTDDFLYIIGLWLAEGGKEVDSLSGALSFSVGGIPGAVDVLRAYFARFGVTLHGSPENAYDYSVSSSVFAALFAHLGLFGTAKRGEKRFPFFFWDLSQRQRRVVIAGLWDGDGSHVFKKQAVLSQKSNALIWDARQCLLLDGLFPIVKDGRHRQKQLHIGRARDFQKLVDLYPLRHPSKRRAYVEAAKTTGRDTATGLWKCSGLWDAVSAASLAPGVKTHVYNAGGKYDHGFRAQRSAFAAVPALERLVSAPLAFLRVVGIEESAGRAMYDLSVEGAENFLANGVLAHNSGYPDCRPEYIEAFERMANLATRAGVEGTSRFRIHTPLIGLAKAEIVRAALGLGVDVGLTWSCYDPREGGRPCGSCDACVLRRKGFTEAGATDPLETAG